MVLFKNAKVITNNNIIDMDVLIKGSKIVDISTNIKNVNAEVVDCKGNYLSSGFIDLHVHGGGGFSAMGSKSDIISMAKAHAKYGTTSILPTTLAAPISQLKSVMNNIKQAQNECKEANILGVHLEGPFISKKMSGAQNPENLLIPAQTNYEELLDYSDLIKIIGVAPELEGAFELAEVFTKKGIVVSIAHSTSDFNLADYAFNHGFSDVTHLYNACTSCFKEGVFRKAGTVEAALTNDNCTVQVISDLRHLPLGVLKLIYKCKGADKMYLITDGLEYSAMDINKGEIFTQQNGVNVIYEDEVMKLADHSCLAGSTATSNRLVRNMYKHVGIPLPQAVKIMNETPAKTINIDNHKGKIEKGYDADIIVFDEEINILKTMVMGQII